MNQRPTSRRLRENPDLEQLRRQGKELLHAYLAGEAAAVAEVSAHYSGANPASFALHDALLVLARSHGFESWPKLKAYIDGIDVRRLVEAVRSGDLLRVRKMLKLRPELVNMSVSYGDEHRAIHFAVMHRSTEMVRLLMEHGADARAGIHPHRDATAALTLAVERGFDEIASIIREVEQGREKPRSADPTPAREPEPAARLAVIRGDTEWLLARHSEGVLRNETSWDSGGLLTLAVRHGRADVLQLLLDLGFDPDEPVASGEGHEVAWSRGYPLWECAARGHRDMAEILLRHGADPNAHVDSSGSAVYSAYSHRQWAMVEWLRTRGGVVTADIAALYRQTELAREILAKDPDASLTLLEFGASGGDPEIVRMALECTDWPREDPRWFRYLVQPLSFWNHIPWLYAANPELDRGTYLECFTQILARCDPNIVGGCGRTVLHETAAMGDYITGAEAAAFASALLDAGAKTDFRDEILQSTPLGWACRWGRTEIVQSLLERGADPVEADAQPWARPTVWAQKMGHTSLLALLRT